MIAVMLKTSNETLTSFDVFISRYTEKQQIRIPWISLFHLGQECFMYTACQKSEMETIIPICYPSI